MRSSLVIAICLAAGCGSDGGNGVTADGGTVDAAASDAARDGATPDGATPDGATLDGATPDGATVDGGACHGFGFGAPAVTIRNVATLPAASGGNIPPGTYDAVDAQTTGATTGSFRSTWVFAGTSVDVLDQITLTGTPPTPVPRTFAVNTSTQPRIMRTPICGSTTSFDNEYSIRTVGADTFLDLKQNTLLFVYRKR